MMMLNDLLTAINVKATQMTQNILVSGLAFNSKKVEKGFLFVAISGNHMDGHSFIEDAIQNGAVAIIGEKCLEVRNVPYFQVNDSRTALAYLAKKYFQNPTKDKILIGITGTNGKTTTSYMIKHILESQGFSCALFGSISVILNNEEQASSHTTLDPLTFHELVATSNDQVIIMEVSSHGLIQQRVEGLEFDVCIFTNLEQEHLDYHKNMESYYLAKQSLFTLLKNSGTAIIYSSNDWSERLNTYVESIGRKVIKINGLFPTYSVLDSSLIDETTQVKETFSLATTMQGKHNIENASVAFATSVQLGIDARVVEEALNDFKGLPGRFQLFSHPTGATIVIDYAHTANAFQHILETVKSQNAKNIYHVFGFRGNRDVNKRAKMIEISLKHSNQCILTFDDLNNVSPEQMINELQLLGTHEKCIIIPDRTEAIKHAWKMAQANDWIVITGKGCESYKQSYTLSTTSDVQTLDYLLKQSSQFKQEAESC